MVLQGKQANRIYRSTGWLLPACVTTGVTVGLILIAALSSSGRIFGLVLTPFFLLMTWTSWNQGVHVNADGVRIQGFFRSVRIPWKTIERFEVRPCGRYPFMGFVVMNDGSRARPVPAISSPIRPESRLEEFRLRVQGTVDELNQLLAEKRGE
jgi:hypothetical protein